MVEYKMLVNLEEKNLLIVSNAYPNLDKNFTQGIFIKNQMDAIKKKFNKWESQYSNH